MFSRWGFPKMGGGGGTLSGSLEVNINIWGGYLGGPKFSETPMWGVGLSVFRLQGLG